MTEIDKRDELVKLATKKEIPYSVAKVKKMTDDEVEQVYEDYLRLKQEKELDALNESLALVAISRLDNIMKKYSFIDEESTMGERLQGRKLFVEDLKYLVSYVTPLLPFVGLFDGGLIIVEEVLQNKNNDNSSSQTDQGGE